MPISGFSRFMKFLPPPLPGGYVSHLKINEDQPNLTSPHISGEISGEDLSEETPAVKSLSEIIGRTFLYRNEMQASEKAKTSMNEEPVELHANVDFNSLLSLVNEAAKNASGGPAFINVDENESLHRGFEAWGKRIFSDFKPGKAEEDSEANTQTGFSWLLLDSMVDAKNLISFQERVGDSMREANYSELKKQQKMILRNSLLRDLRLEGWFPAESLANKIDQVFYEQPLRAEILNYLQEGVFSAKGAHEKARLKEEQVSALAEKYPLPKNEIKAIFSEVSNFHEEAKGSLGTFMDLVKRYDLVKDHKSELAIIGAFSVLVNSIIVAGPLLNNIAISHSQPLFGLISLFTVPVLARAGGIAQELYFTDFLSRIGNKIAQKTTPNMVGDPSSSAAQALQVMNEGKLATVETIKAVCGSIPQVGIQSFVAAAVLLSSSSFLGPVALLLALASIPLGPLMARGMEKCQAELVEKRDAFAEMLTEHDGMRALQTEPRTRNLVTKKMLDEMLSIVEATRKADKKAVIFYGAPELLSNSGQLAIAVLAAILASTQDPLTLVATVFGIKESMCQVHGPVAGAYAAIRRQIDVFGPRLDTFHDTVMGERAGSGTKNLKPASSVQGHQITIQGFKLRSGGTLDEKIPEGSFTVVTGPHDAGKSSLLLRLSGVGSLGQGNIRVGDTDLKNLDIRGSGDSYQSKLVSFCGTKPLVFENLSLAKNISLNLEAEEDKDRLMNLLHLTGFFETSLWTDSPDSLNRKPVNLSPEATFSLDLARALFKNPKILVLDEPTLRVEESEKIRKIHDILARVHEDSKFPNLTIICATHNQSIIDGNFGEKQIIRLPEVLTSSGEE